jgi:hypothetical protein
MFGGRNDSDGWTDHCSFTTQQSSRLGGTIGGVPGGCAGVAQRAQLLYTYGVRANRIRWADGFAPQ